AWLLAPRRGEMVADYCAGAGGKTLAVAMLMRGSGRIYAMDVSARRLAALAPRGARAGITSVHTIVLSGGREVRSRAGRCAVQRFRHAAAQSGPEVAAYAGGHLAARRKAARHPCRGLPAGHGGRAAGIRHE